MKITTHNLYEFSLIDPEMLLVAAIINRAAEDVNYKEYCDHGGHYLNYCASILISKVNEQKQYGDMSPLDFCNFVLETLLEDGEKNIY